jgi:hypothetical protein
MRFSGEARAVAAVLRARRIEEKATMMFSRGSDAYGGSGS